jgi:hypothetical protein
MSTIQNIDTDIATVKNLNPNWATEPVVLAILTALLNEKNALTLRGTLFYFF